MKKYLGLAACALMMSACFSSCSSDEASDNGTEVVTGDTVWYEVKKVTEFAATEFMDSLCTVEPEAKNHIGMLATFIPKDLRMKVVDYLYESSNGLGGVEKLSGQLIVPTRSGQVTNESLIIDNRATQIADADVPTNQLNIGSVLCLTGAPVVTADLLGYGATVNTPISYNCRHTAAVNTVDAAVVAQQMLHSKWMGLKLSKKALPVYSEGYSQGGYDALAVMRYLETEAEKSVKEQLPLVKTKCGAGAYDQRVFFVTVMKWNDYAYSPYIVTSFISFMNYHKDLFPQDFKVEDVLNEKVRNSELIRRINSKQYADQAIKDYVVDLLDGDVSMSNIFVEDLINPNGTLHNLCLKVAEYESVLDGWKPAGAVDFFHAKNDDCVPVECMYAAQEAFKGCKNVTFEEYDAPAEPGLHSKSYVRFITNILLGGW